jgi:1-acyl-sn-glycerol-3-phosphate acyltransferase
MVNRLERTVRVFTTGFCFVVFGVGGLLLPVLVLLWAVRDPVLRAQRVKRLIRLAFRAFLGMMQMLGVMRCEIRGRERLQRQGLLVLANHPTLLDVVFLMALTPRADCVVKAALRDNPFTRGPVAAAGFVCNDSGADLVQDCIDSLRGGNNLIIFPEGTRSPRSGGLRLQRGAANVAVRGRIDMTPVTIRCHPPTLSKGEKWYHIPVHRMHFVIEVQEDIPVSPFLDGVSEALAARNVTAYLTDYFSSEAPGAQLRT